MADVLPAAGSLTCEGGWGGGLMHVYEVRLYVLGEGRSDRG